MSRWRKKAMEVCCTDGVQLEQPNTQTLAAQVEAAAGFSVLNAKSGSSNDNVTGGATERVRAALCAQGRHVRYETASAVVKLLDRKRRKVERDAEQQGNAIDPMLVDALGLLPPDEVDMATEEVLSLWGRVAGPSGEPPSCPPSPGGGDASGDVT